jgi:RNA polymerase sigma-70 factor (ECF subfamily)
MANPTATTDPADRSDEQLAQRVQDGCAESFAELDRRLRPRLLHVLTRRLPTREDAEDVVQQTLLRVYEKIHLYDPRQRLSPWIFTIALRLAAGHSRRKTLPMGQQVDGPLELTDGSHSPPEQASRREERDQLWQIADRALKAEQWTALWLFYGEEQSIKEVAQSLGRTKTSVSVLLFRARKALLPHLKKLTVTEDDAADEEFSNMELSPTLLLDSCSGDAVYQLAGRNKS